MKKFDQPSIQSRLVGTLSNKPGWSQVISDSGTTEVLGSIAEAEAENARYFEYLLKEAKWSFAKNFTSLAYQSTFLGYKPLRKRSSVGVLIFSHDPALNTNAGVTIFTVEDLQTLSSFSGSTFTIPIGTVITDGTISFITTQQIQYNHGDKFQAIPIVQGILKTVNFSVTGTALEIVSISSNKVEAANNPYDSQFLTIFFTPQSSSTPIAIPIIEDIQLAAEDKYACEVTTSINFSTVTFTFGNNITGKQLSTGTVTVNYMETLGSQGNISKNFTINTIISSLPNTMYCTNLESILGGRDEDTVEDVRNNAPGQYLLNGGIITADAYKKAIGSISSISKVSIYASTFTDNSGITKNAIYYTAIQTDGTAPDAGTFPVLVNQEIAGRNSPLDYLVYSAANFLHLRLNIQGQTSNSKTDLLALNSQIQADLYNKYGTLAQDFMKTFDPSSVTTYVRNTYGIINISPKVVEVVKDLFPSHFTPDNTVVIGNYISSFQFDKSYVRLKSFNDGVLHCLRINIVCNSTCTQKSRTLFVIQDSNSPGYKVLQYRYQDIDQITSIDYMTKLLDFAHAPVQPINPSDTVTPYVPFVVQVNLANFNPSGSNPLGSGSLSVPQIVNGNPFYDFTNPAADTTIQIQIIAEPYNYLVIPTTNNSIIRIDPATTSSSTNFTSDINVEITQGA